MIATLRRLSGPKVGELVATKAAPKVDAAIKATARSGTTPEGTTWKPKKDGGRPLVNAAAAISTKGLGNLVVTTLTAPTSFHHKGLGGKPTRQVIPDSGTVPDGVKKAVLSAATEVFSELTRRT